MSDTHTNLVEVESHGGSLEPGAYTFTCSVAETGATKRGDNILAEELLRSSDTTEGRFSKIGDITSVAMSDLLVDFKKR